MELTLKVALTADRKGMAPSELRRSTMGCPGAGDRRSWGDARAFSAVDRENIDRGPEES